MASPTADAERLSAPDLRPEPTPRRHALTGSIWYGIPQDQIQAFRAFEIAPQLQDQFGYPALTAAIKRKILGLNSARIYDVKPVAPKCTFTRDDLQRAREAIPAAQRTYGPETLAELRTLIQAHGPV